MDRDDWADRHVARWRDHWLDVAFDDDVEAIVVRMGRLVRHFKAMKQQALAETGLQDFEYETLHLLIVRDTPGHASPSALAADLGISNAGMTGRLDALEKVGWVQRSVDANDRRRVGIEVTKAGMDVWRHAITLRGRSEEDLVRTLSEEDRKTLAQLLKTLALTLEDDES